ncbi:DNA recombination protein RmuC [Thalassovita mediterranea]|jgi:DNA recombination protein RmuC|uniref:DNA recombination protein RmuC homolog n=2 Tax=Thalassovita mediterranea TaxID=340021 RepID=A0A0P1GRX4_9RHOB|nr:DNA recombination protein RmuC [Thalassovita mediterranea]CUH85358.1 DNA recombination protein RmuC [Thalassovita mediterranea]SIS30381.1 DNA recombination protein RmuC [Thalassovita mediterranea]
MMDLNTLLQNPAALIAAAAVLAVIVALILRGGAQKRAERTEAMIAQYMGQMAQRVDQLAAGQAQLDGGLRAQAQASAQSQGQIATLMEQRLGEVQVKLHENLSKVQRGTGENLAAMQQKMADTLAAQQLQMQENLANMQMRTNRSLTDLHEKLNTSLAGNAKQTATSLTQLQERLATIDKAQENITKLSGDVLSLQDILSNKQTRGAFGEIQLNDIVGKALPRDSYTLQHTLTNGKRADCLIHLPNPPGPIVIDSKFPLEAYEAMLSSQTEAELKAGIQQFKTSVRKHIKDISDRYIIEGETADGALMFLPSEAIYAELHSKFSDLVREGFERRVWIVSPTTCMATLNTMRAILKDARMREQAGEIRKALRNLHRDVEIVGERAGKLETHLRQAGDDVAGILTAATRANKRAHKLDNFDFEELAPEPEPEVQRDLLEADKS